MQVHQMKLKRQHFNKIASGEKWVEMRVADEKRKQVLAGDRILFSCEEEPMHYLTVSVCAVQFFADFFELAKHYGGAAVGFSGVDAEDIAAYMCGIYGADVVQSLGVVALEISLLSE